VCGEDYMDKVACRFTNFVYQTIAVIAATLLLLSLPCRSYNVLANDSAVFIDLFLVQPNPVFADFVQKSNYQSRFYE